MNQVNLSKSASILWGRITTSRFTALYLIFIAVYSIFQLGLRAQTYASDSRASQSLETILISGRATTGRIPVLAKDSSIRLCDGLPFSSDDGSCSTVWDASGDVTHILVREDPSLIADQTCLEALNYPVFVLHTDLREDVVSLALQLFCLGLAITALAKSHLSHFITGVMLQIVSCIWAAIRVADTGKSASEFERTIVNGACGGQLLGNFWAQRWGLDVAVLSIDVLGLVLSSVFTWKAAQGLGLTNTTSSQVSTATNCVYKVLLAALVVIELSLFFSVAAGIVWIDELFHYGSMMGISMGVKVMYILAEILMIPFLILGWVALYREMWKCVLFFLGAAFVYVAGWGFSFVLEGFRWSIASWRLFGWLSIFAFVLALLSFTLSIVAACYFGKGMTKITNSEDSQPRHVVDLHTHSRDTSVSSMEKGEYYSRKEIVVESFDEKRRSAGSDLPRLPYAPRVSKAKATAVARGLSVTPPPLH